MMMIQWLLLLRKSLESELPFRRFTEEVLAAVDHFDLTLEAEVAAVITDLLAIVVVVLVALVILHHHHRLLSVEWPARGGQEVIDKDAEVAAQPVLFHHLLTAAIDLQFEVAVVQEVKVEEEEEDEVALESVQRLDEGEAKIEVVLALGLDILDIGGLALGVVVEIVEKE